MGAQAFRLTNADIDNALKNKHFNVVFQPVFNLADGSVARVEAFARWDHPGLGLLPPGAFISFFEAQGRIGEFTRYILDAALDAHEAWRGGAPGPGLSVNISTVDITDATFPSHLEVALGRAGLAPHQLTLECPLPEDDDDIPAMAKALQGLKESGVRLAAEARGRVTDRLKQFDPFPFDEIKTGGAAILRFARTVRGPGLTAISDLLDLAKVYDADTVAVGVEDQASLSALRGLGFRAAQGNHLARPGGLEDFAVGRLNDVREQLGLTPLPLSELRFAKPSGDDKPAPPRFAESDGAPLSARPPRFADIAPSDGPSAEETPDAEAPTAAAEAVDIPAAGAFAKRLQVKLVEEFTDETDDEEPKLAEVFTESYTEEEEATVIIAREEEISIPAPSASADAVAHSRARMRKKRFKLKVDGVTVINGFWPRSWERWWENRKNRDAV